MARGSRAISVTGFKELQKVLRKLGPKIANRIKPDIRKESARILGIAADRVSVGITGQLRRNIGIMPVTIRWVGRNPVSIDGGFFFLQSYAVFHHEGVPANGGNTWPNGGQRKYAETAMQENIKQFWRVVGKSVGRALS